MRVPSVGQPLDERRIVREGYQLAERMMRNYRDPPRMSDTIYAWLAACRQTLLGLYRVMGRD